MGKTKTKAPAEETDLDIEDLDLDEDTDDDDAVEETEAPATKSKAKPERDIWGTRELCAHISEKIGKEYTTKELRTLLRKMARDGRIEREVVAGNKAPYEWSGPKDPEVKAIVAAVKGGEVDDAKKEALDALKEKGAAKKAKAEKAGKAKGKGKKGKAAPVEDDDEDDD